MRPLLGCALKSLFLVFLFSGLSGCSTIHFDNGSEPINERYSPKYSQWHHDGIFELVEFSDPEDMQKHCSESTWSTVKVEQGFPQAVVYLFFGTLYSPWDVEYACTTNILRNPVMKRRD